MHPHNEKKFARNLRAAFAFEDRPERGEERSAPYGDRVIMETSFLEGEDKAIISINFGDVTFASCYVTRDDLLRLKREFDVFAKVKQGKPAFTIGERRRLKRLAKTTAGEIEEVAALARARKSGLTEV